MAFNKKFFTTGGIVASTPAAAAFDPLQNFEIVTYTGNGGTKKITGYIKKGAAFNGSSSKVILPESTTGSINSNAAFSVSFWFFANSGSLGSTERRMITLFDGIYIWIEIPTNENLRYRVANSSSTNIENTGTTTITENAWHHIVLTGDSTNGIIAYLDGSVEISSASWNGTFQNGSGASRYDFNVIGGQEDNLGSLIRPFLGKIDQVRIFDEAISSDQVTTLRNETYNSSTKSTTDIFGNGRGVALYELDENANDTGGTYNGTPTNVNFLGMAFQPDFVWIKNRDTTAHNGLFDSVRGEHAIIYSNLTNEEATNTSFHLDSFDNNGFTVIGNSNVTNTTDDFVAWCWKAADTTTTIAANTVGNTIASDVRANTAAGFSIVKFTGNNASSATIAHGLNSPPEMIIQKRLDSTSNWATFHTALGATKAIFLDQNSTPNTSAGFWNNTAPTSTVMSIENLPVSPYVHYCFHSVPGYSAIGSYTGVSGDIEKDIGFRPRFIMIKNTSDSGNWEVHDSVRHSTINSENGLSKRLRWNDNSAEAPFNNTPVFFRDTGFTLDSSVTNNTYIDYDKNGDTFIYLAIA